MHLCRVASGPAQKGRYHETYRYHASGSASHRKHFAQVALPGVRVV